MIDITIRKFKDSTFAFAIIEDYLYKYKYDEDKVLDKMIAGCILADNTSVDSIKMFIDMAIALDVSMIIFDYSYATHDFEYNYATHDQFAYIEKYFSDAITTFEELDGAYEDRIVYARR